MSLRPRSTVEFTYTRTNNNCIDTDTRTPMTRAGSQKSPTSEDTHACIPGDDEIACQTSLARHSHCTNRVKSSCNCTCRDGNHHLPQSTNLLLPVLLTHLLYPEQLPPTLHTIPLQQQHSLTTPLNLHMCEW